MRREENITKYMYASLHKILWFKPQVYFIIYNVISINFTVNICFVGCVAPIEKKTEHDKKIHTIIIYDAHSNLGSYSVTFWKSQSKVYYQLHVFEN